MIRQGQSWRIRYLYTPAAILIGLTTVVPTLALAFFIFQRVDATNLGMHWNRFSLTNLRILTEERTIRAAVRTYEFAAIATTLELILGTSFGLMLNLGRVKTLHIVRLLAIPVMVGPLAVGMLWKLLFAFESGVINRFLFQVAGIRVPWLSLGTPRFAVAGFSFAEWFNINLGFLVLILADLWQWTPFVVIVVMARLYSIPPSLTEAARIDGLEDREIAQRILLPLLAPTLTLVAVLRLIDALRVFENIWTLFGDNDAAASMSTVIVRETLLIRDYGRGATVAAILILMALASVALAFRAGRRTWVN